MLLRSSLPWAALVFLATSAMAQPAPEIIPLWPVGNVPNALTTPESATITEKSVMEGGILRLSDVQVPTLTLYRPAPGKRPAKPGKAVMICPGGGYWILASGHEGADMARWFTDRGITAFVLKYRLPDSRLQTSPHEVPLMDAMQGMKLIRQRAAALQLDPTQVGVMGFSAGGHLAATLATQTSHGPKTDPRARPDFTILIYPVITFGDKTHPGSREKLLGTLATDSSLAERFSAEKQVSAATPPAFLVHSMDDTGVPVENSIGYYLACLRHGVKAEMHLYPTGGHGYGLRTTPTETVSQWPTPLEAWLAP